ncbi:MAG: ComF family protein [Candidatus Eremiobacteraeota bacterium]|nr:ComF family protein [Candidatus Eremiobacteraeota bacterium]
MLPALAEALAGLVEEDWVLVGVPAVASRKRYRGFEPAVELARTLADKTGLEHRQILVCGAEPGEQKTLSAAQREANLAGVFKAVEAVPRGVLLVDDVITTGATLKACARALGPLERLEGLCLARVARHSKQA